MKHPRGSLFQLRNWFLLLIAALATTGQAQTSTTLTILHTFPADGSAGGVFPSLVAGTDGNFYGTAGAVSTDNNGVVTTINGTVFRLTPAGVLTTLYSGNVSTIPLTQDSDGNLYGALTPSLDGSDNGAIFKLAPGGAMTILHTFSGKEYGPSGRLLLARDGNLYGVTDAGGLYEGDTTLGDGEVYRITPTGGYTVLHAFAANSEGGEPAAGLIQGADGNFYGTTSIFGSGGGGGAVFRITSEGQFTILHSFAGGSSDGGQPEGDLVEGRDGNFYGTTSSGGAYGESDTTDGEGTVFRISPAGEFALLHSFSASEGYAPRNGLILGSDGNFYGGTGEGGAYDDGTIYRITATGAFSVICELDTDGGENNDSVQVAQGSNGNLYGATGGNYQGPNLGVLFELTGLPEITSALTATAILDQPFSYHVTANNSPDAFTASGLPQGMSINPSTGEITGMASTLGNFPVTVTATGSGDTASAVLTFTVAQGGFTYPAFFEGETALGNGVYYLSFPSGHYFGYYSYLSDPHYIYHDDLGYEYVFDAADGKSGVYFYDFKSQGYFYTSPTFPFPYLYDFTLKSVVYYYPDPSNPGRYNTNGYRFFYVFNTGKIISK